MENIENNNSITDIDGYTYNVVLDPESDGVEGYVQDTFHYELNYEGDDGGDVEVSVTEIDS